MVKSFDGLLVAPAFQNFTSSHFAQCLLKNPWIRQKLKKSRNCTAFGVPNQYRVSERTQQAKATSTNQSPSQLPPIRQLHFPPASSGQPSISPRMTNSKKFTIFWQPTTSKVRNTNSGSCSPQRCSGGLSHHPVLSKNGSSVSEPQKVSSSVLFPVFPIACVLKKTSNLGALSISSVLIKNSE